MPRSILVYLTDCYKNKKTPDLTELEEIYKKNENLIGAIHEAAKCDFPEVITWLIGKGVEVDELNDKKSTPLMIAALNGAAASARILIKFNANVNAKNSVIHTPLTLAVLFNRCEVVEVLLSNSKINVNEEVIQHWEEVTALIIGVIKRKNEKITQLLLDNGANPAVFVETPSEKRAYAKTSEVIRKLITQPITLLSYLHRATYMGTPILIQDMENIIAANPSSLNQKDCRGRNPLQLAYDLNAEDAIKSWFHDKLNMPISNPSTSSAEEILSATTDLLTVSIPREIQVAEEVPNETALNNNDGGLLSTKARDEIVLATDNKLDNAFLMRPEEFIQTFENILSKPETIRLFNRSHFIRPLEYLAQREPQYEARVEELINRFMLIQTAHLYRARSSVTWFQATSEKASVRNLIDFDEEETLVMGGLEPPTSAL